MKLEKFDYGKSKGKKYFLYGVICTVVLTVILNLVMSRASYKNTESINIVNGTINYKVPDLRLVALYTENDSGDYEETTDIPTSGYTLNEEKSVCKVYDGTTSIEDAPVDTSIAINYENGKVDFIGISKKNTRCYLYFDTYKEPPTIGETIHANITVNTDTPDFNTVATTDEGVYAVEDGMYGGTSYYWRGAVTNNYVIFAGFCWRIIRINGDGSIRLIYDGAICHANGTSTTESIAVTSQSYNLSTGSSVYVGWSYTIGEQHGTEIASNARTQVETWYTNNLGSYANYIADGKYCNDREVASGYTWESAPGNLFYYAVHGRLVSTKIPTLSCTTSSDVFTVKIGLITADEVSFAGGVSGTNNTSYYLYNGNYYWTISPYIWFRSNSNSGVFVVSSNGNLENSYVISTIPDLRPVINLKADVAFSSGNGTYSNPYVVKTS